MAKPEEVQSNGVTLVVYTARSDAGDVSFEYRCRWCHRYGVGSLSHAAAILAAQAHRCHERGPNEFYLHEVGES